MFSRLRRRLLACTVVLGVAAATSGCQRSAGRRAERLAVLPFDNLTGDPALEWVGPALREGVVLELAGLPGLRPGLFRNSRDAAAARATRVLSGYFIRVGPNLRLQAELRPLEGGKPEARRQFSFRPEDLLRLCPELAYWVTPAAGALETQSLQALRSLAEARVAESAAAADAAFARGLEADPDFGPLYLAWAQSLLGRGQREAALEVLSKARGRGERIRELRRLELAVVEARARGDRAAQRKALRELAARVPADSEMLVELSRLDAGAGDWDAAAARLRQVVQADPGDPVAWNELGYAEARRRRLEEARTALEQYRRLAPKEANPLDSLGDVHYYLGQFGAASNYYAEAFERDPNFLGAATLYKAARARLMAGDLEEAARLFARYAEIRRKAGDPALEIVQAQWQYLSGEKGEAVERLRALVSGSGEIAALAAARLSAWELADGRSAEAERLARQALARTQSPLVRATALLTLIAAGSPGAEGVPEGSFRNVAEACRQLLAGRYGEAERLLRPLVSADPFSQEQTNVLLAWALVEQGRFGEAAPLLDTYGLPPAGMEPPLVCLTFPRSLQLKARVLAREGKSQEAARWESLYRRLTAPGR